MNRKIVLRATVIAVLALVPASILLVVTSRAAPPVGPDDRAPTHAQVPVEEPQPVITTRNLAAETVLYTVHQGTYESAIDSALKLQALREEQGYDSSADFGYFVYLNHPELGREEDRLIEIRLPVGSADLAGRSKVKSAAAAKGLGTTDIKEVGPSRVAITRKSPGVSDPTRLWEGVYAFANGAGLDAESAGPMEKFSAISTIPATCTYDELETELMVGIE